MENLKNKNLLFLFAFVFLFSFVSASIDFDNDTYTIDTIIPTWLGSNGESVVTLIDNTDTCLINCEATLEFQNEKPVNLLDGFVFENRVGTAVDSKIDSLDFSVGQYQEVEKNNYSLPIYSDEEICINQTYNESNFTNETEYCYYPILEYKTYTEQELLWRDYNGEEVDGLAYLKIKGKKKIGYDVDWIIEFRGKELVNWAWWDSDWNNKRLIDLTASVGNFSYIERINYSSAMQTDFDDIRFLNEDEDKELNFTIQSKVDSSYMVVRIFSQSEDNIYMYYGNSGASSTSSASDTHFNPFSYYYLDETTGTTSDDAVGSNNGTISGATINQTGKIGKCYDFDGSNDYVEIDNEENMRLSSGSYTISMWFKADDISTFQTMIWKSYTTSGIVDYKIDKYQSKVRYQTQDGGNIESSALSSATWYHVVAVRDLADTGSEQRLYINGVSVSTVTSTGTTVTGNDNEEMQIGRSYFGTSDNNYFNGKIDEVGIYDKALTATQINQLYTYTAPTYTVGNEESNVQLLINLNSPTASQEFSNKSIYFNCNATSPMGVYQLNFSIDGILNQTVTGTGLTNLSFSDVIDLNDGTHNYTCSGYDDTASVEHTKTFSIDTTPFVEFITPTPANDTNWSDTYIPIGVNVSTLYFKNITYNLYNSTDLYETQTFTDETYEFNFSNYLCDNYEYNVTVCTTTGQCNSTETRLLHIDILTPEINITSPNEVQDYLYDNKTLDLNYSITDDHLDSCWYSYSGLLDSNYTYNFAVNQTITDNQKYPQSYITIIPSISGLEEYNKIFDTSDCSNISIYSNYAGSGLGSTANVSILCDDIDIGFGYVNALDISIHDISFYYGALNKSLNCSENTTLQYINGANNLTVYANDTFGNVGESTRAWTYKISQGEQLYSDTARSGNLETYNINITVGDGYELASSKLIYEGVAVTPIIYSSGDLRALTAEYVPLTEEDVNNTFYWEMTLTDDTVLNSTENTQFVTSIYLDNCSNYTYELFNLSLWDEETQQALSGDIELAFTLQNKPYYQSINTRSIILEDVSNARVCSDVNLTGENLAYSAEIRYSSDGYSPELYHIQKADLNGDIANINLYDLNSSSATEFKITYQDSNFEFISDAVVQLQRKYISEDVYKTVEAPLTSDDGIVVLHIDLDSVKYKATVVKDGEVLNTFDNIVFVCDSELTGECTQKLLGEVFVSGDSDYDTTRDFVYSVSRVDNDIIVDFSIPTTTASSVNIVLDQVDQFGTKSVCNKTVISSSGSMYCTFNDSIGDSYLTFNINKDNEPIAVTTYKIVETNDYDFLGNNYIIVVILLLSLVGMSLTSPEWMIMNGIITLVIAAGLYLVKGLDFAMGLGLIMWLLIAAVIIIIKLAKQEDR